jgi:hypothetical protein
MTFNGRRRSAVKNIFAINYKRLFIGVGALALGTMIYLTERPHDSVAFIRFIPFDPSSLQKLGGPFGPVAGFVPDLLHIFAFILLTGAMTPQTRFWDRVICAGWLVVETAFEVGQGFGAKIAAMLPRGAGDHFLWRHTAAYFIEGTFDPMDLVGILIGMIAAYGTLCRTRSVVPPPLG